MKTVFLLMFMLTVQLNAQTPHENNFVATKAYLKEIQEAVDYAPNSKKEKVDKLDKIIRQGSEQTRKLKQALKNTRNTQQQARILREFSLILQAVVLLKTDINANIPLSEDLDYLNKSIPVLLKKL